MFIPYYTKIAGAEGSDFASQVYIGYVPTGAAWADWLGSTIRSGNVIFLGGTPGAASSQSWLNSFKEGLAKHPDIKLLDEISSSPTGTRRTPSLRSRR